MTEAVSRPIRLETADTVLILDRETARLLSVQRKSAPECEFIEAADDDPAFVVQYLVEGETDNDSFRQLPSWVAESITVAVEDTGDRRAVTARYEGLGASGLCVTFTVAASASEPLARFSLRLENPGGLKVTDVQYPFVICGDNDDQKLLWPSGPGVLIPTPARSLWQDEPWVFQFRPENGDAYHYPGYVMAQFMAVLNGATGLYVACEDSGGRLKQLKPASRDGRLRLGFGHWGEWESAGGHDLGYDVVLGSFEGDWYDGAALYRDWSLQQPWATGLTERTDVPDWLLASPPHIIVRIQGELDDGPGEPNEEFLPYPKIVPLLEAIEARVESPLVAVIMSWERPGPWVYPDCFPPAGGFESLAEFCDLARQRNWHVGSFCNGTRWVTGHKFTGYDGRDYFQRENGAEVVCQTAAGKPWYEGWDDSWRPSLPCCLGHERTHTIATDFVRKLRDTGLDWVQFLDQNVGCCAFACYGEEHGHAGMPGEWMNDGLLKLTRSFLALGEEERARSGRWMAFSVECPINEYYIPQHAICDIRVEPPGHTKWSGGNWVPLYHFLYHELILIQGGFGMGPEPYHMPIRNSYNLVLGQIPGGVLKGDGTLLNLDTQNWGPWEIEVGSNEDALTVLRSTTALRRGPAEGFLVYGRMLRPATVDGIETIEWEYEGQPRAIPAVFHAAWQTPDESMGLVLANWTTEDQTVSVRDDRLGDSVTIATSAETLGELTARRVDGAISVTVPALGSVVVR